ncbi:MAG: hypothetical protein ACRCTR_02395 [Actinomycetota bacterium]
MKRSIFLPIFLSSVVLSTSACGIFSPATTNVSGEYSDGVSLVLAEVQVEALGLVIVGEKDEPALLSGVLVNKNASYAQKVTLIVQGEAEPVEVEVEPKGLVTIGGEDADIVVPIAALSAPAGGTLQVVLGSQRAGNVSTQVPIVPAEREYADITPVPSPTSPGSTPAGAPG